MFRGCLGSSVPLSRFVEYFQSFLSVCFLFMDAFSEESASFRLTELIERRYDNHVHAVRLRLGSLKNLVRDIDGMSDKELIETWRKVLRGLRTAELSDATSFARDRSRERSPR